MLLLIAVLATLSAAFLTGYFIRRRAPQVTAQVPLQVSDKTHWHPLFEPSIEDLKREERDRKAAESARSELIVSAERRARITAAIGEWRGSCTITSTCDLLQAVVENGNANDLSQIVKEILDVFYETGIRGLTTSDLAALIDSHCRLVSATDRASGALFWLKQEVAELRARKKNEPSIATVRKN